MKFLPAAAVLLACQRAPSRAIQQPAFVASSSVVVSLDHVFLVLDSSTFAAVRGSEVLGALAAVQDRTTTGGGGRTWSGTYVQGRYTYVELFSQGSTFGPPGSSGVAFNVSVQGGIDTLRAAFERDHGPTRPATFHTGLRDGKQEPWYYSFRPWPGAELSVSRWVMEYHPEFTKWEGSDTSLADGRAARRRVPRRRYDASRPLLDVVGVTLALPDSDRTLLRNELGVYGWSVQITDKSTGAFVAAGPDIIIRGIPAIAAPAGIKELTFKLARANSANTEVTLGSQSRLKIDGALATWTFQIRQ